MSESMFLFMTQWSKILFRWNCFRIPNTRMLQEFVSLFQLRCLSLVGMRTSMLRTYQSDVYEQSAIARFLFCISDKFKSTFLTCGINIATDRNAV